jgi:hypothetical protein
MPETRPLPIRRLHHQPSLHRIAMDVPQLLHPLRLGEYVEIVIASVPERPLPPLHRNRQLQSLQSPRQHRLFWLAQQKVHMLRHHHISRHNKCIANSHCLERSFKYIPSRRCSKMGAAVKTTEGDEMQVAALLKANQASRHPSILTPRDAGCPTSPRDAGGNTARCSRSRVQIPGAPLLNQYVGENPTR